MTRRLTIKEEESIFTTMADVEGNKPPQEEAQQAKNLTIVDDLSDYPGTTVEEKVDSFIAQQPVAIISKSWCPFCRDVKDLFGNVLGVQVHSIESNLHPDGGKIFK